MPEIGEIFSRKQIHEFVGGGDVQSYLPHSGGRVLCGCFDPGLNLRAPREIDVGNGPDIIRYAEQVVNDRNAIPVFLKLTAKQWEYCGEFKPVRFSRDQADIRAHKDRRSDTIGVLFFEEVEADALGVRRTDLSANEGGTTLERHLVRERSRWLARSKKRLVRRELGFLKCEACDITSRDFPDDVADACFEVHHRVPLARLKKDICTRVDDLALVCANCHRMIHAVDPFPTVGKFRDLLRGRG